MNRYHSWYLLISGIRVESETIMLVVGLVGVPPTHHTIKIPWQLDTEMQLRAFACL
jgi:hypothetical protein